MSVLMGEIELEMPYLRGWYPCVLLHQGMQ